MCPVFVLFPVFICLIFMSELTRLIGLCVCVFILFCFLLLFYSTQSDYLVGRDSSPSSVDSRPHILSDSVRKSVRHQLRDSIMYIIVQGPFIYFMFSAHFFVSPCPVHPLAAFSSSLLPPPARNVIKSEIKIGAHPKRVKEPARGETGSFCEMMVLRH